MPRPSEIGISLDSVIGMEIRPIRLPSYRECLSLRSIIRYKMEILADSSSTIMTQEDLAMADGDLVLMEAATSAIDLRICRALIKYGADINRANRMRTTALHVAASQGRADIVRLLIRAGADLNHCDRHGHGTLSCAILRNQRDVARLLLKHAADPHRQPEALGLAVWEGNLELVKALINKGWDIHSKSHQGRTALQHARNRHHKSVIRALLDAGAT